MGYFINAIPSGSQSWQWEIIHTDTCSFIAGKINYLSLAQSMRCFFLWKSLLGESIGNMFSIFGVFLSKIQSYFKGNAASINYALMLIFHGGINRGFRSHGEIPQPTQPFAFYKTRAARAGVGLPSWQSPSVTWGARCTISDGYDPWTLPQELVCAAVTEGSSW